VKDKRLS